MLEDNSDRVLFISMPMASLHHPSIGLSLLQGALSSNGIQSDIRHLYLDFANFIGLENYLILNDDRHFLSFLGEWIFSNSANQIANSNEIAYLHNIIQLEHGKFFSTENIKNIIDIKSKIPDFLEYCINEISLYQYDVIGFTTSFQQTMASLALAKLIKLKFPNKLIVFGGANCEGEMGFELHTCYSSIDIVVSGEAESIMPMIVSRFRNGKSFSSIPNIVYRKNGGSISSIVNQGVAGTLDELPYLNYDDFYSDRSRFKNIQEQVQAVPLFESSRGCWWGAKHHCTFCGLNGQAMSFRSKGQGRALNEIKEIATKYGREILVVDNILDYRYFDTYVPELANFRPPLLLHYEVKVNLRSDQIIALSKAGIRKIQPGIESLSSRILDLMDKGTNSLRNIQTLKLAAEAGIYVDWGHLFGFPGESAADYEGILSLIQKVLHLQPPTGFNKVRADRFSPYFKYPEKYSIEIKPNAAYKYIYPFDEKSISNIAYHFDIFSKNLSPLDLLYKEMRSALEHWREKHSTSELYFASTEKNQRVVIDSRRSLEPKIIVLSSCSYHILMACSEICSVNAVLRETETLFGVDPQSELKTLLENDLVLREGDSILSLPLRQPGLKRAPAIHEIRHSLELSYLVNNCG